MYSHKSEYYSFCFSTEVGTYRLSTLVSVDPLSFISVYTNSTKETLRHLFPCAYLLLSGVTLFGVQREKKQSINGSSETYSPEPSCTLLSL